MPKSITVAYNHRKVLFRINKKKGTNMSFVRFRMLYYLKANGPTSTSRLGRLGGGWVPTVQTHLPSLFDWGYITTEEPGKKYSKIAITTAGLMWLDLYDKTLHISRNDRIC